MSKILSFVPIRIDREPNVLLGITASEIYTILWVTLPMFGAAALIVGLLLQSPALGIFIGFTVAMAYMFAAVIILAKIKRNKPPNYIIQSKYIFLEKIGLKKAPFIWKSEVFKTTKD